MSRHDQPARPSISRPGVPEIPFRKPKPRAKGIGWSRYSRQGRCERGQQVTNEAEGPSRFGTTPAGPSILARDDNRCAQHRGRHAQVDPRRNASRHAPFGINLSVGTTTERDLSARPLSNKTTRPIHLDMHRAPTTTIAGRPSNGYGVQRRGALRPDRCNAELAGSSSKASRSSNANLNRRTTRIFLMSGWRGLIR